MNGTVAQIVAITSYANAKLEDNSNYEFKMNNSTAVYCNEIVFIDWVKKNNLLSIFKTKTAYGSKPIASDFMNWITFLKKEGTKKLFLHYVSTSNPQLSDRMSVGFVGGGGRWLIEAWKGKSSDFWEAKWEVKKPKAKNNKIWSVTYARIARDSFVQKNEHSGLKKISKDLKKAITACYMFSKKHSLANWDTFFYNALICLENGNSDFQTIYHKDIVPISKFPEEAIKIIFATQSAWVFGGMGSWNDMGFEGNDQTEYEKISDNLFSIECKAIAHATNEYGK